MRKKNTAQQQRQQKKGEKFVVKIMRAPFFSSRDR